MSLRFLRSKPLQAVKFAAIIAVLLYAGLGIFGRILDQGAGPLLLPIVFSLALTLVIAVEALRSGYLALRADGPLGRQVAARPGYTVVRVAEAAIAIIASGVFIAIFTAATDGPMAGPGAIGLALIGAGLGLLVIGASLVRTLTEYYFHRRSRAA